MIDFAGKPSGLPDKSNIAGFIERVSAAGVSGVGWKPCFLSLPYPSLFFRPKTGMVFYCLFFKVFSLQFNFGEYSTRVFISREIPLIEKIASDLGSGSFCPVIVADENTRVIAEKICGDNKFPLCVLKSGEENKNWTAVHEILSAAFTAGLGRDGIFIAAGGGVIGDLCGFAASIYMRGCRFVLASTTLLGMVDASVGGKTGFDLFGVKNLAGSFYPAEIVYLPMESLSSLPAREWKSGMAELIKTAVLDGDDFIDELSAIPGDLNCSALLEGGVLGKCIERAVSYKGGIVSKDLRESGLRMLLNLGHTFGHALESSAGLGKLTHGEAVAWGIVRSCELGTALGITPKARALKIRELIASFGYNYACPHPLAENAQAVLKAMKSDKKKKSGKLTFIVPDEKSARPVVLETENEIKILENILKGGFNL
jgi:3-dehydroquinate synthase